MFVVLNTAGDGADAIALFSSRARADDFIRSSGLPSIAVEEHEVNGDYEFPAPVYVAHVYEQDSGHRFAGLFSSQSSAMGVVGLKGHAVRLMPDAW